MSGRGKHDDSIDYILAAIQSLLEHQELSKRGRVLKMKNGHEKVIRIIRQGHSHDVQQSTRNFSVRIQHIDLSLYDHGTCVY